MVVVLLLMLAVTSLVLFSARNATLGETIARNQVDAERARQAAESALRDAERDLVAVVAPAASPCTRPVFPVAAETSLFATTCQTGLCDGIEGNTSTSSWGTFANAEPWWPVDRGGLWNNASNKGAASAPANCGFAGAVPLGTFTGLDPIPGVARQPEYLIERFSRQDGNLVFFRITARGFGALERTQVVLQAYYRPFTAQ
jgi:type IV pilus assembly protein PilX